MAKKWNLSPAEVERRRREKGLRLSGSVTEHRQADGTHFYSVRSETTPAKLYRIQWDRLRGRWACNCKDATYHQATQYRAYKCSHLWAIELSLALGSIHGIDSLVAARQRYENGGVVEALRGMVSNEQGRRNTTGVLVGKTLRGRR